MEKKERNIEHFISDLEQILILDDCLAVNKETGCPVCCSQTPCDECLFSEDGLPYCDSKKRMKWLHSYYEKKPNLTKRERDFIDCIIDDFYIVNDGTGLFVHFWTDDVALEIYGDLFKFIKSKESMSKKDLLSLEVE